jgi:hypothetical protein
MKTDKPIAWELEQQLAFQAMVNAFTTASVLRHFDHETEVIIDRDASKYVTAGVLSPSKNDRVLHSVVHFTKKHTHAECNYDICDTELMTMIETLEEWRPECKEAAFPLQLITDYKNLENLITNMLLN